MPRAKKSLKVSKDKFKRREASSPKGISDSGNIRPLNTICCFPDSSRTGKSYDLTPFYGKGFDEIINRVYYTIDSLLNRSKGGNVRQSSIYGYLVDGFKNFAAYLALWSRSLSRELIITDINESLIENYIVHLRIIGVGFTTQKKYYSATKSLLKAIASNGYFSNVTQEKINNLFPENPYPNSTKRGKGETPFTQYEKRQLVVALKQEITPIYQATAPLSSYELTVCILSIAMQTGINTTPLLSMTLGSMSDHPLKKNRKLITVFKARGSSTQLHSFREPKQILLSQGIKLDVAYIIERIIELNTAYRTEAGTEDLFIFRPIAGTNKNFTSKLSDNHLVLCIKKLREKHGLKDEDGQPMKINISRIRKTFINRI